MFIDEAYSLIQKNENDFGKEAVSVLVKEMEEGLLPFRGVYFFLFV